MRRSLGDNLRGQRHHLEVVEVKQAGAQTVVDIVGIIGDVVRDRGDLCLQRGETPQFEIIDLDVVGDADGNAALAITPGRRTAAIGQRAVVLDDALQRFPGQVEPVEFGIALFQGRNDAERLGVVIEAAKILQAGVQRPLAGVPERRMAEIVGERQGFREVLVQPELPGQRAGDLRHLQRMGQPGAVVVALVEHEHLGLVFQPAERGGMDHPVAIPSKRAAGPAWRFRDQSAATALGIAGIGRVGGSHSDGHGEFSLYPFDSAYGGT
ncbi:hypothetical protein ACVWZ6_005779 [Bradyrhizobium sp. GM6.1]